ncbi:MAG TPA: hypothetical protein VNH43_14445 [Vicinamibacteria bacterium]|nr:hypothetical protein [Vicinamibacteria bacterium]
MIFALGLALLAAGPLLREERFRVERPSEVVVTLTAGCERCDWGQPGREAAALVLSVDGKYSQHLILSRGEALADYRVALGSLAAGPHRLQIRLDRGASARHAGTVTVQRARFAFAPEDGSDHAMLAFAPILHARPDTLERFTDLPLLMWCERETIPGGVRLRYSVIFSNEDGGTPIDRLMATWGRATDIEYVYSVELDDAGKLVGEEFQGKDHKLLPFRGPHEGTHPLEWVVTDNNMVGDQGDTARRYALAPEPFDLTDVSREAVMDAHPWTYRVSAQEARREGRVAEDARPGAGKIPDPRRFVTLEACGEVQDAALAFALGAAGPGGETRWYESDGGLPAFRVARSGCVRSAVALPPDDVGRLVALQLRAHTRVPQEGEPPLPPGTGRARVTRINKLFLLGEDDEPAENLFGWAGEAALVAEGPPLELALAARPR